MKKLFWRPPGMSRTALVLIGCVSLAVMVAVEAFPVERKQDRYAEKIAAARLARSCMNAIKAEKKRLGIALDPQVDPAETGMIGESVTLVTSNTGFIGAKLTSTNPNFAAVVVLLLEAAGARKNDTVAVGVSGSFPALNVATYAAIETLDLRPIIIASASSSEWGANHERYLWIDMDRTLRQAGLVSFGVRAASYGGIDDLGVGITEQGRTLLDAAIERNELREITPQSLSDSINQRMALFDELAGAPPIKAYINVGGGSASVGTHVGKKQFKPGMNRSPPAAVGIPDSVMLRFAKRGVPVIHISRIKLLAEKYGLPLEPRTPMAIGQGKVFVNTEYNRTLALAGLLVIFATMWALLRWSVGLQLLRGRAREPAKPAEPMV